MEPLSEKALNYTDTTRWAANAARLSAYEAARHRAIDAEYAADARRCAYEARWCATEARKEGWYGTFI